LQVVNISRKVTLVEELEVAKTYLARLRGLLGREAFSQGSGLLIQPCNWVHTLGMKFPIDVIFLDQENKVVATESLKPNRFGKPQRSCSALELPWGTIRESCTKVRDKLEIGDF
jgi:uncharacterized membrane protein (UPF0127 family)